MCLLCVIPSERPEVIFRNPRTFRKKDFRVDVLFKDHGLKKYLVTFKGEYVIAFSNQYTMELIEGASKE